jgi:hypothetical protein
LHGEELGTVELVHVVDCEDEIGGVKVDELVVINEYPLSSMVWITQ